MEWTEIKDLLIVAQILISAGVVIWMKFFYSELKQRDIKIDHIDQRLKEVEVNYNSKFNKVFLKQDEISEGITDIKVNVGEIKQMVADQKEFCTYVQQGKVKNGRK